MVGGGFLSCGLTASSAMSGLTVSIHLVYLTLIAQYIVFEILTEARAGWTAQPGELARSLSSELRTSAHLFWGGIRHGKYWQNLHTQGQPPVWGGFCHAGYQQALQCQGLQSVCIWFTLAEFDSTYCLKYEQRPGRGERVSPQGWQVLPRVNYVLRHICFEEGFRPW